MKVWVVTHAEIEGESVVISGEAEIQDEEFLKIAKKENQVFKPDTEPSFHVGNMKVQRINRT